MFNGKWGGGGGEGDTGEMYRLHQIESGVPADELWGPTMERKLKQRREWVHSDVVYQTQWREECEETGHFPKRNKSNRRHAIHNVWKGKKKTFQHEQHQIVVEALVGQTDRLSSGTTEKNSFLKIDSLLHFLFYLWCVLAFTHLKIC